MEQFEPRANVAKFGLKACMELEAEQMCPVGYIFKEFEPLKKLKNSRENPPSVRDLRQQGRVNHAQMLELKKGALDHIKLLTEIQGVVEGMKRNEKELENYFIILSEYDQDIAEQDVGYIKGKLDEFDGLSDELMKKFHDDVKFVARQADAAVIAEQIENFLKDGMEALHGIGPAIVTDATLASLEVQSEALRVNTQTLANAFKNNKEQINEMEKVIDDIKTRQIGKLGAEGTAEFIAKYGDYTPRVDEDSLAQNDALWSAYKEKVCDMLTGAEGLGASGVQIFARVACEKLDGTLSQYFALRENIFSFQFDLVDTLAKVIRAFLARELAKEMKIDFSAAKHSQRMLFFFKA